MKNKKGITLVSLVVTIIVLIILAGVSINLTLGENGIITMAKRARENMELAKIDEERQLNELYEQIVTEGGSSGNVSDDAIIKLAQFKREIASALTDIGIETSENSDISTMASNIRSLAGALSADKVSYDNTNSELVATNVQGAVDELDSEINNLNDSLGDVSSFTNNSYNSMGDYIEYCIENGYLPDINNPTISLLTVNLSDASYLKITLNGDGTATISGNISAPSSITSTKQIVPINGIPYAYRPKSTVTFTTLQNTTTRTITINVDGSIDISSYNVSAPALDISHTYTLN